MIEVSETASQAIKKFLAEKNLGSSLRIILQDGCGGPSLRLTVDEAADHDETYEKDAVTYVIDQDLSLLGGNIKIDFVDDGGRQGFIIAADNPLDAGCGGGDGACGQGCCSACH